LSYASRKGFKAAVIAGQTEFAQGNWQVKDLQAGQQTTVTEADLVGELKRIVASR
jgi:histidyl-tRNA synthetase